MRSCDFLSSSIGVSNCRVRSQVISKTRNVSLYFKKGKVKLGVFYWYYTIIHIFIGITLDCISRQGMMGKIRYIVVSGLGVNTWAICGLKINLNMKKRAKEGRQFLCDESILLLLLL